jgi:ElaA protein
MTDLSAIDWQWAAYEELTRDQLAAVFELRQAVFIVEQNCPYPDIDGKDPQALHLMAWLDNRLVATLRLFPSYKPYQGHCSLGRICSRQDVRRLGVGKELVRRGLDYIDRHYPDKSTQIGAQHYLKRFYQGFGFVQCSEPYDEDGIEHILMIRAQRADTN